MALTIEMLDANEELRTSLSPYEKNIIVGMSEGEEDAVIGRFYGDFCQTIENVVYKESKRPKRKGEKCTAYLARILRELSFFDASEKK